jgi:predicted DNA repair protein MutK
LPDFILSAEIMAITLASLAETSFTQQVVVLAVVGFASPQWSMEP